MRKLSHCFYCSCIYFAFWIAIVYGFSSISLHSFIFVKPTTAQCLSMAMFQRGCISSASCACTNRECLSLWTEDLCLWFSLLRVIILYQHSYQNYFWFSNSFISFFNFSSLFNYQMVLNLSFHQFWPFLFTCI